MANMGIPPKGWVRIGDGVRQPCELGLTKRATDTAATAICDKEREHTLQRVADSQAAQAAERKRFVERMEARIGAKLGFGCSPGLLRPPTPWDDQVQGGVGGKIERMMQTQRSIQAAREAERAASCPPRDLESAGPALGPAGGPLSGDLERFKEIRFPMTNKKFWDNLAAAEALMDRYEADQRVVKRSTLDLETAHSTVTPERKPNRLHKRMSPSQLAALRQAEKRRRGPRTTFN